MPARPDGTEPVIAYGSIFLRAAERDDIPASSRGSTTSGRRARSMSGRRSRSRWRKPGSSRWSPTRARSGTCSRPASSPTTGRSAASACSASISSTGARASASWSAHPVIGPRPRDRHAGGAAGLRLREPAPRADLARRLRLQPRCPPSLRAGGIRARRDPAARLLPRGSVRGRTPAWADPRGEWRARGHNRPRTRPRERIRRGDLPHAGSRPRTDPSGRRRAAGSLRARNPTSVRLGGHRG